MVNWPEMNSLPTQSLTDEQFFRPSIVSIVLTLHSFLDAKAVFFYFSDSGAFFLICVLFSTIYACFFIHFLFILLIHLKVYLYFKLASKCFTFVVFPLYLQTIQKKIIKIIIVFEKDEHENFVF